MIKEERIREKENEEERRKEKRRKGVRGEEGKESDCMKKGRKERKGKVHVHTV